MDGDLSSTQNRPAGFIFATVAVILQAIIGFVGFTPAFPIGLIAAVSISVIYPFFFWRGSNWARIVVILVSATDILLLYLEGRKHDTLRIVAHAIDLPLAVFLLYWLNTKPVKQYFKGPPTSSKQT